MESKYGLRYFILLDLPYFDPVRVTAIDTMHNLYLGTGKHAFKIWINLRIFLVVKILQKLTKTHVCFRYQLVPVGYQYNYISSNYSGFKADQWRTWIIVYSPELLKGIPSQ